MSVMVGWKSDDRAGAQAAGEPGERERTRTGVTKQRPGEGKEVAGQGRNENGNRFWNISERNTGDPRGKRYKFGDSRPHEHA